MALIVLTHCEMRLQDDTLLDDVPSVISCGLRHACRTSCVRLSRWLEALTQAVHRTLGRVRHLFNDYGPTEVTIDVWARCVRAVDRIGVHRKSPCRTYFAMSCIDARRRMQPVGMWGELWLGGVQVARGYLRRPELTAERFVASPWPSADDACCRRGVAYRTGDRVRWYADGELEFGGRIDLQVKLRGQRLELGEIEHALRAQPGVLEAVVLLSAPRQVVVRRR